MASLLSLLRPTGALVGRPLLARPLRATPAVARALRTSRLLCSAHVPPRLGRPHASAAALPETEAAEHVAAAEYEEAAAEPSTPNVPDDETRVHMVEDVAQAHAALEMLRRMPAETFHACDTEVSGLDLSKSPLGQGRVICFSVYSGPDADYGSGPGTALWVDTTNLDVLEVFKPWLEDRGVLKVWHYYAFDRHVLWNHGVNVRGFGGDTMHMARLWDASRISGYSLEALTDELVGRKKVSMKQLFGEPVLLKNGTPGKKVRPARGRPAFRQRTGPTSSPRHRTASSAASASSTASPPL